LFPTGGGLVTRDAELVASLDPDPERDLLTCEFQVYADSTLAQLSLTLTAAEIDSGSVTSGSLEELPTGKTYWWRVRLFDGYEYTEWSAPEQFALSERPLIRVPQDQPTIQAGIEAVRDGDTVLVSPGTYHEHIDFRGRGIVVMSASGAETTTIAAVDSAKPVVSMRSREPVGTQLLGFTISGAQEAPGVYCYRSSPTITACIIAQNSAIYGGGINLEHTWDGKVIANTIHGNRGGEYGGGIYLNVSEDTEISRNVIYNNSNFAAITLRDSRETQIRNNTIVSSAENGIFLTWAGFMCSAISSAARRA